MEQVLKDLRWLEVRFYFTCLDLMRLKHNLMNVMSVIDGLAPISNYSAEQMKGTTQKVLCTEFVKPTREECLLLCMDYKIPVRKVCKRFGLCNNTYYELLHEAQQNPRIFMPKLKKEELENVKKFMETIDYFKGVGI